MSEPYLTADRIYTKYPDRWVIVIDVKEDRYQNLLGGHVVFQSPDRDEVDRYLDERPDLRQVSVFHTEHRPFWAGPLPEGKIEKIHRMIRLCFSVLLLVVIGWVAAEVTVRIRVPLGIRQFDRLREPLEAHAAQIRNGVLRPDPNQNDPRQYPLPNELREGGIDACQVFDRVIWYSLPNGPLDGGSRYLVTPIDASEPVTDLPGRRGRRTYHFQLLNGNWAYWFWG
jgi:hypothetical protein